MAKQIIIVQAGWVYIGEVTEIPLVSLSLFKWTFSFGVKEFVVTNAYTISDWGTTSGLGEIAVNGPTPKTVLEFVGTMQLPNHAVISRITCVK